LIDKKQKNSRGFIALTAVLIILAIVLAVSISLSFRGINETQMSLQKNQSSQSYYLASLCAEKALMDLKQTNGAYGGTGGWVDIENGRCNVLVEGSWVLKVSAVFANQTQKIKIAVDQINPKMIINSWQEVSEF